MQDRVMISSRFQHVKGRIAATLVPLVPTMLEDSDARGWLAFLELAAPAPPLPLIDRLPATAVHFTSAHLRSAPRAASRTAGERAVISASTF